MSTDRNSKINKLITRLTEQSTTKDKEVNLLKYKNVPPHKNLHNFHTIKWLRSRFNHSVFNRSINTMLPNNGAPVEDPDKESSRLDKAKDYLTNYCQAPDKFKNIHISPKYLYSQLVMTKIKKLLDIFLEFDEDGSRKLEIGEMVVMFNTNKIPVEENELVGLFFKDKVLKKDEEPYLDFYQFMLFALSKASDQDFRSFMRKLKKKKNEELKTSSNLYKSTSDKNEEAVEDENLFLPMNFNLVLDYFNNKGKQRDSQAKIQEALDIMEEIIALKNKKVDPIKENDNSMANSDESQSEIYDNDKEKDKGITDDLEVHNKINTDLLFEEFSKLFGQRHASENANNSNRLAKKLLGLKSEADISSDMASQGQSKHPTLSKVLPTHITTLNTKTVNSDKSRTIQPDLDYFNSYNNDNVPMIFTNYLRAKIDKQEMSKTAETHYEKYKSLYLAAEEAKKKLSSRNSTYTSNFSNFKTTANGTAYAGGNFKFKGTLRKTSFVIKNIKGANVPFNQTGAFNQTGHTFYQSSNKQVPPLGSSYSNKSEFSKNLLPYLPITKHANNNTDYIPMKLMKELNQNNSSNFMNNMSRLSGQFK